MILRLLCIWLVFYSLLSSLILSNLKHELLNQLRSTMAANVLKYSYLLTGSIDVMGHHSHRNSNNSTLAAAAAAAVTTTTTNTTTTLNYL
jgi:hypothetical protein